MSRITVQSLSWKNLVGSPTWRRQYHRVHSTAQYINVSSKDKCGPFIILLVFVLITGSDRNRRKERKKVRKEGNKEEGKERGKVRDGRKVRRVR